MFVVCLLTTIRSTPERRQSYHETKLHCEHRSQFYAGFPEPPNHLNKTLCSDLKGFPDRWRLRRQLER